MSYAQLQKEIEDAPLVFVTVPHYTEVVWKGINFSMPKSGEYPKPIADLYYDRVLLSRALDNLLLAPSYREYVVDLIMKDRGTHS